MSSYFIEGPIGYNQQPYTLSYINTIMTTNNTNNLQYSIPTDQQPIKYEWLSPYHQAICSVQVQEEDKKQDKIQELATEIGKLIVKKEILEEKLQIAKEKIELMEKQNEMPEGLYCLVHPVTGEIYFSNDEHEKFILTKKNAHSKIDSHHVKELRNKNKNLVQSCNRITEKLIKTEKREQLTSKVLLFVTFIITIFTAISFGTGDLFNFFNNIKKIIEQIMIHGI